MPSFYENTEIDTSSIKYSKTGIRLLKFFIKLFGLDKLEKVKKGELIVMYNGEVLKYDENLGWI
jgi:hypothetical protein